MKPTGRVTLDLMHIITFVYGPMTGCETIDYNPEALLQELFNLPQRTWPRAGPAPRTAWRIPMIFLLTLALRPPMTLEQVGGLYSVSGERIRAQRWSARKKLQHPDVQRNVFGDTLWNLGLIG